VKKKGRRPRFFAGLAESAAFPWAGPCEGVLGVTTVRYAVHVPRQAPPFSYRLLTTAGRYGGHTPG